MTPLHRGTPDTHRSIVEFLLLENKIVTETGLPETAALYPRLAHGLNPRIRRPQGAGPRLVLHDNAARSALEPHGQSWTGLPLGRYPDAELWYNDRTGCGISFIPDAAERNARRYTTMQAMALYTRLRLKTARRFFFHAAGIRNAGRAVLIAGRNESGKSSLMLALALAGYDCLADDSVILEKRRGGVSAFAVRQAVQISKLSASDRRRLTATGFSKTPMRGFFYPPRIARGPWPVGTVIFSQLGRKASCEEIGPGVSMPLLTQMNETPLFRRDYPLALDLYGTLAEQSRCFVVTQKRGAPPPVETVGEIL